MPPEVKVSPTILPEFNPRERYAVVTERSTHEFCVFHLYGCRAARKARVWGAYLRLGDSFIQIPKTSLGTARAPFLCKKDVESDIKLFSCREKSSCPFRAS